MGLFGKKENDVNTCSENINKNSFELTLEQYACTSCKLKIYINIEDYVTDELKCPSCSSVSKNVRLFNSTINSIVKK